MSEDKTRASASAAAAVAITLTQPWGPSATLADVRRVAEKEARDRIQTANELLAKHGIQIGAIDVVRIVITEEKP